MKGNIYLKIWMIFALTGALGFISPAYGQWGPGGPPPWPGPGPKPGKGPKAKDIAEFRKINTSYGDQYAITILGSPGQTYTVDIYEHKHHYVNTIIVQGGTETLLPLLPKGKYYYVARDAAGNIIGQGKFHVKGRAIRVHMLQQTAYYNDSIYLFINAPVSEIFTLEILDHPKSVVETLTVHGGANVINPLPEGHYSYRLYNISGYEVAKGKIHIREHSIPVFLTPHNPAEGMPFVLSILQPAGKTFTLSIFDQSGTLIRTLPVVSGNTTLTGLPKGHYFYLLTDDKGNLVRQEKFEVTGPHVHAEIFPHFPSSTDSIVLVVNAPVTESFVLTVSDATGMIVRTQSVQGGFNVLPPLPNGVYQYTLSNNLGTEVESGRIEVKPHSVLTAIAPNPSHPGDGSISVEAPATDVFTLKIYDGTMLPVYTEIIHGGITRLPTALTSGIYYYKLLDNQSFVVSEGRIVIY